MPSASTSPIAACTNLTCGSRGASLRNRSRCSATGSTAAPLKRSGRDSLVDSISQPTVLSKSSGPPTRFWTMVPKVPRPICTACSLQLPKPPGSPAVQASNSQTGGDPASPTSRHPRSPCGSQGAMPTSPVAQMLAPSPFFGRSRTLSSRRLRRWRGSNGGAASQTCNGVFLSNAIAGTSRVWVPAPTSQDFGCDSPSIGSSWVGSHARRRSHRAKGPAAATATREARPARGEGPIVPWR
mmetsp:Transcript_83797/g.233719  ORF Transcript_83797/g.233719 Transcript_83797/m.233719 type:complete len:240 (-) Transcript_83797:45-764(-)